jgi:hypothetical protein
MIAQAEATATGVRFMNQHLHERFPSRTLEAIKGLRRKETYKELVRELTISHLLAAVNLAPEGPTPAYRIARDQFAQTSREDTKAAVSTLAEDLSQQVGHQMPLLLDAAGLADLGVTFDPRGLSTVELDVAVALGRLTKAPLKPQQRLVVLRTHLVPKLLHDFTLGNVSRGRLDQIDRQIRKAVRTWLKLPGDVPTAFFHTSVTDGGLGIPSILTTIPALTRARVARMELSSFPPARAAFRSARLQRKLSWAKRVLSSLELPPEPVSEDRKRYWAPRLHASVDGRELRETPKCAASSRWIHRGSMGIPGRDFIQHIHTWINALPSRIRTSRGARREGTNTQCRAGCGETETAAHIIQRCHRTHGGRVKRHDALAAALMAALRQKGWEVQLEPRFQTQEGLRKPDILAVRDKSAMVIDVQVVSGSGDINDSH